MDRVFHMAGGEDEASYAKNSTHQRLVLMEVKPILMKGIEEVIRDLEFLPNCFRVSDLGCSSGPNSLLTAESMVESINKACQVIRDPDQELPIITEIQYFLNDLVSNDFNLVFKGLPGFYEKLAKESATRNFRSTCLISAMPGSFYGKLFPDKSMHFQHSSYCLHWLSQVPTGLVTESGTLEYEGIHCAKTAPLLVQEAYLDQFRRDFKVFLSMRSQELVHHGQLLLTVICKNEEEPEGCHYLSVLSMALMEMVEDGLIREEKLDSFSLPYYEPSDDETRQIVEDEGSFKIHRIHTFKTLVGASNIGSSPTERARFVANLVRAVYGPILSTHFGEDFPFDDMTRKYADKLVNAFQLEQAGFFNNLVISLRKR